jgi:hypothetical protein
MRKLIYSFLVLCFLFALASYFIKYEGRDVLFRGIASSATGSVGLQISETDPIERIKKIKLRILQNMSFEESTMTLNLGAFIDGLKGKSICELYPIVELVFVAEGVSLSGEPLSAVYRKECDYALGDDTIAAIHIKEPSSAEEGIEFWYLAKIVLVGHEEEAQIEMDNYEINFVRQSPLSFGNQRN